ncbi:MAG: MOSC domain-containing protein [Cyanobacteria bacterium J06558_2]
MSGTVIAVSLNPNHTFSKSTQNSIKLLAGLGVAGDAHCGKTVKHRSRVARDPQQPNLRQVHLIHGELHDELNQAGFNILPGQMGENITTRNIDLLGLPTNTRLHIGKTGVIQVTGLRNPCAQLDRFQAGLMRAVLDQDAQGNVIRKSGIMGIVLTAGEIIVGDRIEVEFPSPPHRLLEKV